MLTLIAAVDTNMAIGKNGTIPWHHPQDLAFFMRETLGGAVIMGRRTWESLPVKPLKSRHNIVITSTPIDGVDTSSSINYAISMAHYKRYTRVYGIGGAKIYQELMPKADRLLLTHLDITIEQPDTWFPPLQNEWEPVLELRLEGDYRPTVIEYKRKTNAA